MWRLRDLEQTCWKGEANQQHQQQHPAGRLVVGGVACGCNPGRCPVGSGITLMRTSVYVLWQISDSLLRGRACLPVSNGWAVACFIPRFSAFLFCHQELNAVMKTVASGASVTLLTTLGHTVKQVKQNRIKCIYRKTGKMFNLLWQTTRTFTRYIPVKVSGYLLQNWQNSVFC